MEILTQVSSSGITSYMCDDGRTIVDHASDPRWPQLKAEIDNGDHTVIDITTTAEYQAQVAAAATQDGA